MARVATETPTGVRPASDAAPEVPTPGRRRGVPGFDTLFTLIFGLIGWGVGIERLYDNSFFWHLRTGKLILAHGLPHSDPYSFSAHGTKWVVQSWLAEVLYSVVNKAAGAFGL